MATHRLRRDLGHCLDFFFALSSGCERRSGLQSVRIPEARLRTSDVAAATVVAPLLPPPPAAHAHTQGHTRVAHFAHGRTDDDHLDHPCWRRAGQNHKHTKHTREWWRHGGVKYLKPGAMVPKQQTNRWIPEPRRRAPQRRHSLRA